MRARLAVERYPDLVLAWVVDLPGCVAGGRTLEEAEERLPVVIAEHLASLRNHGIPVEEVDGWEVTESIEAQGDVIFAADRETLSADALAGLVARVRGAQAELRSAMRGLPAALLDWEPPRSAFATFDSWAPDVRSIREVANHVYRFETYYLDGLRDGPAAGIFETMSAAGRRRAFERLAALPESERSRAFFPVRPGQTEPEQWTARKVLRRLISHGRVHAAEIIQRRTWFLLGTPQPGTDGGH